jgi:chromosome segregation ATPase
MQIRYKILILLLTVTLAAGILALLHSSNDSDALLRFRALFSNRTLYNLKTTLMLMTDGTSLWYGGISLFAIIMIVLVLRAARRDGLQGLRERFAQQRWVKAQTANLQAKETLSARTEVESARREELKAMTDLLRARDSMINELEKGLTAKQQLLQRRGEELDALKPKLNVLTEQLANAQLAKERADNALQQELKKIKVLQAKDSIIMELENSLAATQELLRERSGELEAFKSKVNPLTEQLADLQLAKDRAENLLERELQKTRVLQADSMLVEQENSLSRKILALESRLKENRDLLQTRNRELKASRSKVNNLRERLATLGSVKRQTETVLQRQLDNKAELLQSKDTALKELQESSSAKIHALEAQLTEKDELLRDRDAVLATVGSEANGLTESDRARQRAKTLLLQELQNRTELLQAKDAIVKELEERLNTTAKALEDARSEVERLLKQGDGKLPPLVDQLANIEPPKEPAEGLLRPDRKGMNSQLLELGAAKARAASLQVEEAKRATETNDSPSAPPEADPGKALDQDVLLADRNDLIEADHGRPEEIKTDLTKKERD